MSGLNTGRKGPNHSQYLANLNAIPSAQDVANQEENINFDAQLAQFTNTDFINFDFDQSDFNSALQDEEMGQPGEQNKGEDAKAVDFVNGAFTFPSPFSPLSTQPTMHNALSHPYSTDTNSPSICQTPTSPVSFNSTPYTHKPHASLPNNANLTTTTTHHTNKSNSLSSPPEFADTNSRLAAEEDKRRRNTAASARFRVKKKQREQALETTVRELEHKCTALEQRTVQLEMENEWLRGLVVEKNGGEKEDLRAKYHKAGTGAGDRKAGRAKKGVGTTVGSSDEK